METTTEATTGADSRHIYWQLIAPGAVMLLFGARMTDPTPTGFRVFLVAVGGVLLLVGLIRSFGVRGTSR